MVSFWQINEANKDSERIYSYTYNYIVKVMTFTLRHSTTLTLHTETTDSSFQHPSIKTNNLLPLYAFDAYLWDKFDQYIGWGGYSHHILWKYRVNGNTNPYIPQLISQYTAD